MACPGYRLRWDLLIEPKREQGEAVRVHPCLSVVHSKSDDVTTDQHGSIRIGNLVRDGSCMEFEFWKQNLGRNMAKLHQA